MNTHLANRIHAYGGPEVMSWDTVPAPTPGAGQVLVQVKAAGINAFDWKIRQGYMKEHIPLQLPAALGIEFAGVVTALGESSTKFKIGDRVMGPLLTLGAYAQHVVTDAETLTATPESLPDIQAAALPIATLTAWQLLQAAGELPTGRTVLIHGASGGVGGFAVQFAKLAGLRVFATASAASRSYVLGLGADRIIDRQAERFENQLRDVDLVIDLVGGDVIDRSWAVIAKDGALVTAADADILARTPAGRRGLWFSMTPNAEQLRAIAQMVAAGTVRSKIAEVTSRAELAAALERNRTAHAPGKIVLDLSR
jgi:NADPH:quinone reductase-like Zn-dependent oxidoreductase